MASAAAVFDTLRTTLEKDAEKAEDLVRYADTHEARADAVAARRECGGAGRPAPR